MSRVNRVVACVLTLFAASCGGKSETDAKPVANNGPAWVDGGSGAFKGDGTAHVLHGVGSSSGIRNAALARTTADNRARAEIAKIFEVYSASLMKDYMASTTAGDMSKSSEEQHVEQAIKTFSATTLRGVEIIDHWIAPDGTWYALAQLDMADVNKGLDDAKDLNAKVKAYVRQNADRVMGDLEKEEGKRQGNSSGN